MMSWTARNLWLAAIWCAMAAATSTLAHDTPNVNTVVLYTLEQP